MSGHSPITKLIIYLRRLLQRSAVILLFILLIFCFCLPFMIRTIGYGQAAVLWHRFGGGTVTNRIVGEGVTLIFPWDKLYIYDAKLQQDVHEYHTISSDGLNMDVEISVRFRIDTRRLPYLHKYVGPNYQNLLLESEVGSKARALVSLYTPEELYRNARNFIEDQISEHLNRDNLIDIPEADGPVALLRIEDVLIRNIKMPDSIKRAIEKKAEQNQIMLEYEFKLQTERLERERREIEAAGLKSYQDAMPNGISQSYLMLRGIEASLELARSTNSKVLIFGAGQSGLPFILNGLFDDKGHDLSLKTVQRDTDLPTNSNNPLEKRNIVSSENEHIKDAISKLHDLLTAPSGTTQQKSHQDSGTNNGLDTRVTNRGNEMENHQFPENELKALSPKKPDIATPNATRKIPSIPEPSSEVNQSSNTLGSP